MRRAASIVGGALLLLGCRGPGRDGGLARELARLGHRNVIAVVDSAYPAQVAPGIDVRVVGGDHIAILERVVAAIRDAKHVRAKVLLDAELAAVTEAMAPGIDAYRTALTAALRDLPITRLPHEQVIRTLDDTAKSFTVLILKTDLTLPYTSVFLELDCGYWDGEREAALRAAIAAGK
ncbi:MAG: hypothetical protein FJ293_03265 [Planctomycetes bacterium]|nr:hypothetical protein [Planctomycetota bacterium]